MTVKAQLSVRLFAADVLVAESDDAVLWQKLLSAIQKPADATPMVDPFASPPDGRQSGRTLSAFIEPGQGVDGFAAELEIPIEELMGAASPSDTDPFIHLDPRCWEAFKRNTPSRGP